MREGVWKREGERMGLLVSFLRSRSRLLPCLQHTLPREGQEKIVRKRGRQEKREPCGSILRPSVPFCSAAVRLVRDVSGEQKDGGRE